MLFNWTPVSQALGRMGKNNLLCTWTGFRFKGSQGEVCTGSVKYLYLHSSWKDPHSICIQFWFFLRGTGSLGEVSVRHVCDGNGSNKPKEFSSSARQGSNCSPCSNSFQSSQQPYEVSSHVLGTGCSWGDISPFKYMSEVWPTIFSF